MPNPDIAAFLRAHFHSVWTLELLLFLKAHAKHGWTGKQLIEALRTSETVVTTSLASLMAGGLIADDGKGRFHYAPASDDLSRRVDIIQGLYAKKPDSVRRVIVGGAAGGLSAFANAFRFKED